MFILFPFLLYNQLFFPIIYVSFEFIITYIIYHIVFVITISKKLYILILLTYANFLFIFLAFYFLSFCHF
ncbi:hypothetical protein HMPREF3191_00005 [Veillonellaceae bacterium DNF00626]|nr:hypothetical protein HMPREF3191_00005 [Veillonellaceae bacterium DNF00626]